MAIRAAKAVGAEICGVDIFDSDRPSIIEINLSPSLHSINEVSDVNALEEISKYLFLQTVRFRKKKEEKIMKKIEKKKANKEISKGEEIVTKIVEFPLAVDKIIKRTLGLTTPQTESSSEQRRLD